MAEAKKKTHSNCKVCGLEIWSSKHTTQEKTCVCGDEIENQGGKR